jgi:hypothetical protein
MEDSYIVVIMWVLLLYGMSFVLGRLYCKHISYDCGYLITGSSPEEDDKKK